MAFWRRHSGPTEYLASVGFFEGFSPDELERVAQLGEEQERPAGTVLMDQGEVGQECFVIVDGDASFYVAGEYIANLAPGSIVGEMALLDHRPRRGTVVADTDVKLLRFDTQHFRRLLDEMPKARDGVLALLAARAKPR